MPILQLSRDGHEQAKAERERLRLLGWCVALMVLAGMSIATIGSVRGHGLLWLVIALTVGWVLLRPRLAPRVVPAALIASGLVGIALVHGGQASYWYGLTSVDNFRGIDPTVTLVQAYVMLVAGGWLGCQELARHPAAAWLVLGKMGGPGRRGQQWGLTLLLVAVVAGAFVGSNAALIVMLALLAASMLIIRRSPDVAGRISALAFIALGLVGLLLARHGQGAAGQILSSVPNAAPVPAPTGLVSYGAVEITSSATAGLAMVEAFALIGLGCWLVSQNFPAVRSLLGLDSDSQLVKRLQRVTESRAEAVDTAAAELRKLERDLHDGAQARLVALGMNLRAAERLIHTSPDAAAALVAEARQTSARALTELRELVRGVHPPVLADRGLADAVRALALDSPLNVETDVDLPGRLPAPIETACYFAIAELLTNAAKHSGGRDARIAIGHADGVLRIDVTDFGLGGADPARGTGLAGVEKRLAAFDGILAISSPVGGPTIAVLEVPCALSSPRISSS